MSNIKQSKEDSINSYLRAKLPEDVVASPDAIQAFKDFKSTLEKEKEELEGTSGDAYKVSKVYQFVGSDATSLQDNKSAIRSVLVEKNTYYTAQLAKLDSDGVKGLEQKLVDCSRDVSNLSGHFNGISALLKSLAGDLDQSDGGDVAFVQLIKYLDKVDKATAAAAAAAPEGTTAKPVPKLVDQLKSFNAQNVIDGLDAIKGNVETFSNSIITTSVNYQKVFPHLDSFKSLQERLTAAIAKLEEDLTSKTTAAIVAATTELALLEAQKEALNQQMLINPALIPKAKRKGGATTEEDPVGEVNVAIKKAKDRQESNKKLKEDYAEIVDSLKAALAKKTAFNDKLKVHIDALAGTKVAGLDLKSEVLELQQTINSIEGCFGTIYSGEDGVRKSYPTISDDFIHALTVAGSEDSTLPDLQTIHEQIVTLNEGISKAEANSDIKEYIGKIAKKLEGFPAAVTKILNNTLLIEHTLKELSDWSAELKHNLGDALAAALAGSTLNFELISDDKLKAAAKGPKIPVSADSGQRIDNLILELIGKQLKEDDLKFPDVEIKQKDWKNLKAVDTVGEEQPPAEGQSTITEPSPAKEKDLAEWQAWFEEQLAAIEISDTVQQQKIDFLEKLLPEEAVAG